MITDLWQDLRYGARMLLKNPGSALIAVIASAPSIGAKATILSSAEATMWRPFSFPNQERLAMIFEARIGHQFMPKLRARALAQFDNDNKRNRPFGIMSPCKSQEGCGTRRRQSLLIRVFQSSAPLMAQERQSGGCYAQM